jgi:hypothetical protein
VQLRSNEERDKTHSAMMASIIVVLGLPITVGAILPSKAYTMGDDIDPDPCSSARATARGRASWRRKVRG